MQENIYKTEFGDIHYWVNKVDENKPWLVFLPGLTADHRLFDKQISEFEGSYNCMTWDAPGHAASRPFDMKFSLEDKALFLHGIFQQEAIEKTVLIGQSMGGYLAQMYMDKYPDVVAGFISVDSCPLKRRYYSWWELALLKRTYWMYMSIPWNLLVKWGVSGTSTTEYGRTLMKSFMDCYDKKEYCRLADHGYKMLAEAVGSGRTYDIKCPVLLICGERDMAGSAKRYNEQWTKHDGHRLVWLQNAGHNSNTDAPDEVNRLIEEFVKGL